MSKYFGLNVFTDKTNVKSSYVIDEHRWHMDGIIYALAMMWFWFCVKSINTNSQTIVNNVVADTLLMLVSNSDSDVKQCLRKGIEINEEKTKYD